MADEFYFVRRGEPYNEIGISKYFHLFGVSHDHLYGREKSRDSTCIRDSYFAFLGLGRSLEV